MSPQAMTPEYACLIDADHGQNGTLYIEGNKTLISLNLSCKSRV